MNVLITGANGGIGKSLCSEYKKAGYKVIATDIQSEKDCDCNQYISQDLSLLTTQKNNEDFYKKIQSALNGEKIDCLVNNAAFQVVKGIKDLSVEEFEKSYRINAIAPFSIIKICHDGLFNTNASIVNISSIHTKATKKHFSAYSSSKHALSGLTKSLSIELAPTIRVNAILPAAVNTEMLKNGFQDKSQLEKLASAHPANRIGEPEEISKLAIYLSSKEAQFITGSEFIIDGGVSNILNDPENF